VRDCFRIAALISVMVPIVPSNGSVLSMSGPPYLLLTLDAIASRAGLRTASAGDDALDSEPGAALDSLKAIGLRVRAEYAALWMRHDRPEGLAANLERMDHETRALDSLSIVVPRR
jgi:glyoxylase-like metal-dependent hydrolase (beta-lactamase superfamily II)